MKILNFKEFINERSLFFKYPIKEKDKILIFENFNHVVYEPLTRNGFEELGKNTHWDSNFYFNKGYRIFIIFNKDRKENDSIKKILILINKENKIETYNIHNDEIRNSSLDYLGIPKQIFTYKKDS